MCNECTSVHPFCENTQSMTVSFCTDLCHRRGFLYSGLEAGNQCFCGNNFDPLNPPNGKPPNNDNCTEPCSGDSSQICGGELRIIIYKNDDFMNCSTSIDFSNGTVTPKQDKYASGTTVQFTCNDGFYQVGPTNSYCWYSGEFSHVSKDAQPRCIRECFEIHHNSITEVNRTVQYPGFFIVGDTITYVCSVGYESVSGVSVGNVECREDRIWTTNLPVCEGVSCGNPGTPNQGELIGEKFFYPYSVSYICQPGYIISGSTARTCQSDKAWSGTLPSCNPNDCSNLDNIENGMTFYTGTTFGMNATYTCDIGYNINGEMIRICEATGLWSGSPPTCEVVSCGDPGLILNGIRMGANETYGSTVTYVCNTGYNLVGAASVICQSDGTWSQSAPVCQVVNCGIVSVGEGVFVNGGIFTYNTVLMFICDRGYNKLSGDTTRTCQSDGNWSGNDLVQEILKLLEEEPSEDLLNKLTKSNLFEVAQHYNFEVRSAVRKAEIKRLVVEHLVDESVLPDIFMTYLPEVLPVVSPEIRKLELQLKLEQERRKLERDKLKAAVQMKELELQSISTSVTHIQFEPSRVIRLVPPFQEKDVDKYFQQFEKVKALILKGYELVPEAYRQKFREYKKLDKETYVEFSREKEILFDRWCSSEDTKSNYNALKQEFKCCVPNVVRTCLDEHKVKDVYEVAKLADEYFLVHKHELSKSDHVQSRDSAQPKEHHKESSYVHPSTRNFHNTQSDSRKSRFDDTCLQPVKILRDTGASQSLLLAGILPLSEKSSTGANVLISGVEFGSTSVPLHRINLQSALVTGSVLVGVMPSLPVGVPKNVQPRCIRECVELNHDSITEFNRKVQYQGYFIVGDIITYICSVGYEPVSGFSVGDAECRGDQIWAANLPVCEGVSCGNPGTPNQGELIGEKFFYPYSVSYICQPGYTIVGSTFRTCQPDKTWSGTLPSCSPNDCGNLDNIENGMTSYTGTTFGMNTTYTCNIGYNINGVMIRTCEATGLWSGSPPTCEVVSCGDPGSIINGIRMGANETYGSTVTYVCNTGYNLVGAASVTCQSDGTWSQSAPVCQVINCGDPGTPTNGGKNGSDETYGSTVTYVCDNGYNLIGTAMVTCQSNGTWSNSTPTCQIVDCMHPGNPLNVTVDVSETTYGAIVTYSCLPGYSISSGNNWRTCGADGSWTGIEPTCSGF
ncbi:CUB and sushi domain-containing protein 3-like [Anneissia japonica]|uniref:CUB and sushi domain-containing protein 3-like n=1 Tax=Anneissia japonica TaxID=1529436 RepID=UPI00142577B6|nr:CUB and sushi domain-containing protein 3-like [Anneissia japonica]